MQLTVNDGKVDSAPSTVLITSGNTPPVANAGATQVVSTGAIVQLNGSGSTDVDGDPLTYHWSFVSVPAGSTAHLSSTSAVSPTFTADLAGTYVAQLIVNDGKIDSAPSTVTITTNAIPAPTANAGPNQTVVHGTTVTLSGSGSDPQGLPLTLTWSLTTKPAGSAGRIVERQRRKSDLRRRRTRRLCRTVDCEQRDSQQRSLDRDNHDDEHAAGGQRRSQPECHPGFGRS